LSFSNKIKEEILVASARHCCVCHRHKGVKVEVHHIVPKEQGGEDVYENAIALCFDCHSDAGHYYAKHPKGTKFSPSELRRHKEEWFKIVKANNIPQKEECLIHARYLVTKEFEILKELSQKDLKRFPVSNSLLIDNNVLSTFRRLFRNQNFRSLEIDHFLTITREEYTNKYPNAENIQSNEYGYSPFFHERVPSKIDIEKRCSGDGLAHYMLESGLEPKKIAKILTCYEGECAGLGRFQELYILRPLYMQFLVLTNISSDYVTYKWMETSKHGDLLIDKNEIGEHLKIKFPEVSIAPMQSVIVPLSLFLAQYSDLNKSKDYIRSNVIDGDRSIVLDHTLNSGNQNIEYLGIGFKTEKLIFSQHGEEYSQNIHSFDFDNVYWIDGYWNCGSCPHLFFETDKFNVTCVGELFNTIPNVRSKESLIIPKGIKYLVIVELEQEVTTIDNIIVNGIKKISDIKLHTGDSLRLPVNELDNVLIEGHYNTFLSTEVKFPAFEKHVMLKRFTSSFSQSLMCE